MTERRQHERDAVMDADEAFTWLKIPKSALDKQCSDGAFLTVRWRKP